MINWLSVALQRFSSIDALFPFGYCSVSATAPTSTRSSQRRLVQTFNVSCSARNSVGILIPSFARACPRKRGSRLEIHKATCAPSLGGTTNVVIRWRACCPRTYRAEFISSCGAGHVTESLFFFHFLFYFFIFVRRSLGPACRAGWASLLLNLYPAGF